MLDRAGATYVRLLHVPPWYTPYSENIILLLPIIGTANMTPPILFQILTVFLLLIIYN
jgi:hypothetical protein